MVKVLLFLAIFGLCLVAGAGCSRNPVDPGEDNGVVEDTTDQEYPNPFD